jgi:hypothetical protein
MSWWHCEITFADGRKGSVSIKASDYAAAVLRLHVIFGKGIVLREVACVGQPRDGDRHQ